MIMLVGNETRQHCLKDAAMYVLATSIIDVIDRVGLLAKMLQILFSDVMKVFRGRGEGARNMIYTEGYVRI
jgi:hypothetical protein